MENNEEKTCQSCKFYREHYIKRGAKLYPLKGHCVHRIIHKRNARTPYRLYDNCEFWESGENVKKERREEIKTVLREMNEHLRQIELILKDDE